MKKSILFFTAVFSALVLSLLISVNASSNSSRCRQDLLSTCASGNDSCYYWIEETGEKCYFDYSVFMEL